jgi:hypothetical protein
MNRPLIAVAALSKKSVNEKIQLGEAIATALVDHPTVFPTPNPDKATLQAVTQELRDANEEAATGLHEGKQRLRKAEMAFNKAIGVYQDYVNMVAKGDGVIIEQSGLQVNRTAQKTGPTPAPGNLRISGTAAGRLTVVVDPVEKAKAYVWVRHTGPTSPTADNDWRFHGGTPKARTTLEGLTSGTREWLRCAAITAAGQGPWSEPVSRIVL